MRFQGSLWPTPPAAWGWGGGKVEEAVDRRSLGSSACRERKYCVPVVGAVILWHRFLPGCGCSAEDRFLCQP
jgi:hypothetical protein